MFKPQPNKMSSCSEFERKSTTAHSIGGGPPVRKLTSASLRFPVLNLDSIDVLIQPKEKDSMKTILAWIDEQPFSRPKRHLHRDFADGVMIAELIHHFVPKIVELHNYIPASAFPAKRDNWRTLNRKVFPKLEFTLSEELIEHLAHNKVGAIEVVLKFVYGKIMNILDARARQAEMEAESRRSRGAFGDAAGKDVVCKLFPDNSELLVYNGIKYHSQKKFEEKLAQIAEQEQELKELRNKIRRLETLVTLKDERLCAMTMELHHAQSKQKPK